MPYIALNINNRSSFLKLESIERPLTVFISNKDRIDSKKRIAKIRVESKKKDVFLIKIIQIAM